MRGRSKEQPAKTAAEPWRVRGNNEWLPDILDNLGNNIIRQMRGRESDRKTLRTGMILKAPANKKKRETILSLDKIKR